MAELILTKQEKEAESLMEWSEESLGKAVRFCITNLKLKEEKDGIFAASCAQILCAIAHKANAGRLKLSLGGVTFEDKHLGNWQIEIKKVGLK